LDVVYHAEPKDNVRRALASTINSMAQRFIILHEIGHHENGDFQNSFNPYGVFFNMAHKNNDGLPLNTRQEIETNADLYAAAHILNEFDVIKEIFCTNLALDLYDADVFSIILTSIFLVYLVLPKDDEAINYDDKNRYLPNIIRMIAVCLEICLKNKDRLDSVIMDGLTNFNEVEKDLYDQFVLKEDFIEPEVLKARQYGFYISMGVIDTVYRFCMIREERFDLYANEILSALGRFEFI
jgi:hypothetical protein